MLNEKERTKNSILKIFKEIGRERAYHTMTAKISSAPRRTSKIFDPSQLKRLPEKITINEDSSSEEEIIQEPKDSINSLLLGYKKQPKKEKKAKPEVKVETTKTPVQTRPQPTTVTPN